MDCNNWETTGLLYVAKELDKKQASLYQQHCTVCAFCAQEVAQYESDKNLYFSSSLLSVSTTAALDEKVLSLCTSVKPTSIGMLSSVWIKRIVFSALVFAFGAGAGGYFSFAYYHSKSAASVAAAKSPTTPQTTVLSATQNRQTQPGLDSSKSDGNTTSVLQKSVRTPLTGHSAPQGIITVDLKKE